MSSVEVELAESGSAERTGNPIGSPYQDQDALEPAADVEEQSTVAVRELVPVKSLTRPVVKTRTSRKTRL